MARINRFAAATAIAAALSLVATPAMAHDHRRWHDHDGIDAGDVLTGVLILGGIAAIANAVSKHDSRDQAPPPPPYRPESQGYRSDTSRVGDTGLDHAAGMCVDAIERGRDRVDTVDNVSRGRDGWSVSGQLEGGAGFTCDIDNDGRISGIELGGGRADAAPDGDSGQWSDEAYARARAAQAQPLPQPGDDNPPAWVANRPEWHGDDSAGQSSDYGQTS